MSPTAGTCTGSLVNHQVRPSGEMGATPANEHQPPLVTTRKPLAKSHSHDGIAVGLSAVLMPLQHARHRATVCSSWLATKSAALALQKAMGDASLAAAALNLLGVRSPGGGSWTPDVLRGVV